MIEIGIVGASGYGGGELMRWLHTHPSAHLEVAVSSTWADKPVSDAFAGFAKRSATIFTPEVNVEQLGGCELVFLAGDNGSAMCLAPELLEAGCKVVDLSADFRFRAPAEYEHWYKMPHRSPQLSANAAYGLPELHKTKIQQSSVVGNPGCYTTASILALAPLVSGGLVDTGSIVIDGKSGVSGAGRSKFGLDYHFSEANESVSAYKVAGTHRHTGEIEQELSLLAGSEIKVSFAPHLIPMTRGLLASCYANLTGTASKASLLDIYRSFYAEAPFVFISDNLPATKHTLGSNMCHIGLEVDERTNRVTVVSAIDNLGKGMAGQAIQNMNLMLGFEETAGLDTPGLWP